jgi:hypothetical protein
METVNEPTMLLDIERELAGPERDSALAKYDAVLVALERRLEAAMKEGMSPDEFLKVEQLREANTLARKILRLTVRVGSRQ